MKGDHTVKKKHYMLFSCNEWKEYSSMCLKGATDNLLVASVDAGFFSEQQDSVFE